MKFRIESVASGARLGFLSDFISQPDLTFQTPLLLTNARCGTVGHLTKETLQYLFSYPIPLLVPACTVYPFSSSIEAYSKGLASFSTLKEYPVFMTVQDPQEATPSGYNTVNNVSLWSKKGRNLLTCENYLKFVDACKPNAFVCLCDGDTNKDSSNKRNLNSLRNTSKFVEKTLQNDVVLKYDVIGPVEGGYDLKLREKAAREVSEQFAGFLVDGLHNNGDGVQSVAFEEVEEVLRVTAKNLPEGKPRFYFGACTPESILNLVKIGFDVFDTSFAQLATERGSALIFPNDVTQKPFSKKVIGDEKAGNKFQKLENFEKKELNQDIEITSKPKRKLKEASTSKSIATKLITKFEFSLRDEIFKDDFEPILSSCQCFTCKKHSRAYIHHLLVTGELLAPVLLTIHNLHHFHHFFKSIQTCIKNSNLNELELLINKC